MQKPPAKIPVSGDSPDPKNEKSQNHKEKANPFESSHVIILQQWPRHQQSAKLVSQNPHRNQEHDHLKGSQYRA